MAEWLFPTDTNTEENVPRNKHEDLFVFGYACKLFRDDEQARAVDKGTYMIPWMGDERLRIDRYDGRGHLYDLGPYDADIKKGLPPAELSEDEQQMEALCNEERYLELHTDMAEKTMYEEEEWKRYYESLDEGYKAVGFSYDSYGQPLPTEEESAEKPQDPGELPYIPPATLQVPAGMEMPATNKEQAIIEKTAKFIAEHGMQMEILMKAKQANNTQFLFMHFEDTLHPYYRHLVKMIKSKKYVPVADEAKKEDLNDSGEGDDGHGYLHPTLMTSNRASPTPEVYKPIQVPIPKVSINETSYGQLLQSMSKVDQDMDKKNKNKELKKEVEQEPPDDASLSLYSQNNMPPPPGIEPVTLPKPEDDTDGAEVKQEPTDGDTTEAGPPIVPPPPDAQPVVDRMAMYVAKNGAEFEVVVKSKNDPRFQFLESWHVHYGYYMFKRQLFIKEMEREKKEKELEEEKKEREKAEKLAKGVKFKLKKTKEPEGSTLEKKKVFDNDESSDDEKTEGNGHKERKSKFSDRSGTSTPITDSDHAVVVDIKNEVKNEVKNDAMLEKRLAEQKVKDRLAASAREKLSQVDKEKQIKAERKKKAAMFINLLKSKTGGEEDSETKTDSKRPTPTDSSRSSPAKRDEKKSSRHKSKHKTRDRSRDRRSRSRSRSRSKKKRKHRSKTPPSAYVVPRRSPARRAPPPPPPSSRYGDVRSRYSRSPSTQSKRSRRPSRSRSRSSSRTKSKKKRSRSPRSKREDSSSHKKHSKKKKKKKSRSRSRSRSKVKEPKRSSSKESSRASATKVIKLEVDPRVASPAAEPAGNLSVVVEELEDGETRDSSPEPGELLDGPDNAEELFKNSMVTADGDHIRSCSPSNSYRKKSQTCSPSSHRSMSQSPSPHKRSNGSHRSRSGSNRSRSGSNRTRSPLNRSRSPSNRSRSPSHRSRSPSNRSRSRSPSNRSRSRSPSNRSRSRSPSNISGSLSNRSRSPFESRSPYDTRSESGASASAEVSREGTLRVSREETPKVSREGTPGLSREGTPEVLDRLQNGAGDVKSSKNVSTYMLNRVRELIKASKKAIKEEDEMETDDS